MYDEAVLVLAKTIAIDILVDETRRIYLRRLEYPGQIAILKVQERKRRRNANDCRDRRTVYMEGGYFALSLM